MIGFERGCCGGNWRSWWKRCRRWFLGRRLLGRWVYGLDIVSSHNSFDSVQKWVLFAVTLAMKIVRLNGPHHHSSQTHRFRILSLQCERFAIVVANPKAATVSIRRHVVWLAHNRPRLWTLLEGLANLVVSERTGFSRVGSGATLLACGRIDAVLRLFVERERTPIRADTEHYLVGRRSLC